MLIKGRTRPSWRVSKKPKVKLHKKHFTLDLGGLVIGLLYRPRQGFLPLFTSRPGPGGKTPLQPVEYGWKPSMRKISLGGSAPGRVPSASSLSIVLAKFPNLVQHCCERQYDDSSEREPGWFTVMSRGTGWQITVKDPDSTASMTVQAKLLDEALSLANELLGAESAPWEHDSFLASRKPKKRK